MTHDSIGLGEDGPTHQPVEHLAALRAIPNLFVFRPCDTVETVECWQLALRECTCPSVLALTRQNLPQLRLGFDNANRCAAGAYEIAPAEKKDPEVSLFATGSEVAIAVEARKLLQERGVAARVVSVPCFELFSALPAAERQKVVGTAKVKVAVEAAVRQGWDEIIGSDGAFVMTSFGASAPAKDLYKHFGITPQKSPRPRRQAGEGLKPPPARYLPGAFRQRAGGGVKEFGNVSSCRHQRVRGSAATLRAIAEADRGDIEVVAIKTRAGRNQCASGGSIPCTAGFREAKVVGD